LDKRATLNDFNYQYFYLNEIKSVSHFASIECQHNSLMSDLKGKCQIQRGLLFPDLPITLGVHEMCSNGIPGPVS